jgi:predicted acetyltransferase
MSRTTDHPTSDWHIRVPARDELQAYMSPIQLAFAEDPSQAEIDDWLKVVEADRWLGAFEDEASEQVAGCASAHSVRLTVPGGQVAAAAVTGVGVRPDFRRRGILRTLMRRQLADVHERGEPVAALWASEGAIYQRFGYGLAAMDGHFEVAVERTAYARPRPPEGRVRIVSEQESADLIPTVYEAMRAQTPGALSRSEAWWRSGVLADPEYSRRGSSSKFRAVYEADGVAEGYAIYRVKEDWDHRGPRNVLEVREAVTTSARALRGLWRFLFEVDLVRIVKASRVPVPAPLQHLLAEPRALGLVVNDGLWIRLVDLPAALEARRWGCADSMVLEVADDFCPWNAGRWRVHATGDRGAAVADVSRTDDAPDLVLATADLAAVYLGGIRPADLAAAGRIEELTPGAVDRATVMFSAQRTPWCVMMF